MTQTIMNENLTESFIIMAVGMITVFSILALVVFMGQLLIRITNRYAPPQKVNQSAKSQIATSNNALTTSPSISNSYNKKKLAAIIGVVEHITNGQGRIEKIEKI